MERAVEPRPWLFHTQYPLNALIGLNTTASGGITVVRPDSQASSNGHDEQDKSRRMGQVRLRTLHQSFIRASPIGLVSLPSMPPVIAPRPCSTLALTVDLTLICSDASSLKG